VPSALRHTSRPRIMRSPQDAHTQSGALRASLPAASTPRHTAQPCSVQTPRAVHTWSRLHTCMRACKGCGGSGAERGTPDSVTSEAGSAAASTNRKAGSPLAYHYVPPSPRSSDPAVHAHACAPSLCAYVWACAECMRRVHQSACAECMRACIVDGGGCGGGRDGGGDGGRKEGSGSSGGGGGNGGRGRRRRERRQRWRQRRPR